MKRTARRGGLAAIFGEVKFCELQFTISSRSLNYPIARPPPSIRQLLTRRRNGAYRGHMEQQTKTERIEAARNRLRVALADAGYTKTLVERIAETEAAIFDLIKAVR